MTLHELIIYAVILLVVLFIKGQSSRCWKCGRAYSSEAHEFWCGTRMSNNPEDLKFWKYIDEKEDRHDPHFR